ncbi:hypothetical protein HSRCO_1618 [Halanaeroarchaeum sp. HSR-CO]|uniref:hypothetical protein n=1 Tax=Halanaeroarchaeum sp. HSR-CO TaxID=2866382 RepID=UPI00217D23D2|nr:hypothetical protein [Halanaeroarchaeum sp. HSR-CO]UWG47897.1 hypothetical protein HSRCO_1618 [Halanaeroarchaeum sp. HSR-CO]
MATLEEFAGADSGADRTQDTRTVVARCTDCGDQHAVADRPGSDETTAATVCPDCGSPAYSSKVVDE